MKTIKNKQKVCPVNNALTILVGKWKINIIFQLPNKTTRFVEMRRYLGNITQQMLSKQLKIIFLKSLAHKLIFKSYFFN